MRPESARFIALQALRQWGNGHAFADQVINRLFADCPTMADSERGFALELFYGVVRNLLLLDYWIGQLRPGRCSVEIRDLLRLGLYQTLLLDTAPHAAVFETVELAPARARSLVNAVLRRSLREKQELVRQAEARPLSVRFSEPEFLVRKWERQFGPEATTDLCRWNNERPCIYVRVNQLRLMPDEFLQQYHGSRALPERRNFFEMPEPADALEAGDAYAQDPSTALACELLDPQPNERVLDACAAPGGKARLIAEMMRNSGRLIAADQDESRLERLAQNLSRLGVTNAEIVRQDWTNSPAQHGALAERSFDRILVDAPCSNTGVMRRRVDVRWRLRPEDFERMPRQQLAILQAVGPLLRPGGVLVYSTCSLEPEENECVVEKFLQSNSKFRLTNQKSTSPLRDRTDGAFAARLELEPPPSVASQAPSGMITPHA